ncbi:MAG: hypothetical protein NT027_07160 [Proteobacteria bacterium]|nr:hypothetical protein [Pseudomonadota bacterium]
MLTNNHPKIGFCPFGLAPFRMALELNSSIRVMIFHASVSTENNVTIKIMNPTSTKGYTKILMLNNFRERLSIRRSVHQDQIIKTKKKTAGNPEIINKA